MPEDGYGSFLSSHFGWVEREGEIIYSDGRVIGSHRGYAHYTVGQRRGLGIAWPEPLYVTEIDPENNRIHVAERRGLLVDEIRVALRWWAGSGERFRVQIRHRHEAAPAGIVKDGADMVVKFVDPQFAPAPGQLAVFYDDRERITGAGIILPGLRR